MVNNKKVKDTAVNNVIEMHSAADWNKKGFEAGTSGNYFFAVDAFSKTIELDPQAAFVYDNRGAVYGKLGEYQLAIERA